MPTPYLAERLVRDILILSAVIFVGVVALIAVVIGRRVKRERDFKIIDLFRSQCAAILNAFLGQTISYAAMLDSVREMMQPPHRGAVERILLELLAAPRYAPVVSEIIADAGMVDAWQSCLVASSGSGAPRSETGHRRFRARQKPRFSARARSAENLGRVRHRESWPLLVERLNDPRREVRAVALRSLGTIAEPRSFSALVGQVRASVSSARPVFSERALRSALAGFSPELAAELLPILRDPDARLRELAAKILRDLLSQPGGTGERSDALRAPELASFILTQLARDSSPSVRATAASLLSDFPANDTRVLPCLAGLTRDTEWFVRMHAARALGARHERDGVAVLSALATDSHWRVREAAVHAMALCGPEGVQSALDLFLSTPDAYAVQQIAEEMETSGALPDFAARSGQPGHERETETLRGIIRNSGARVPQIPMGNGGERETPVEEQPKYLQARAGGGGEK